MLTTLLLGALTVEASPSTDCPNATDIHARLEAAGAPARESDAIRVHFSREGSRRVAEVEVRGAGARRIEHDGPDCASLTAATVAVLTVLLDRDRDAPSAPPPPPTDPLPKAARARELVRVEALALASRGIVADEAIGLGAGVAWLPSPIARVGVAADFWPAREHPVLEGRVRAAAASAGATGCLGPRIGPATLEACVGIHGGLYALSAEGYPSVRSTARPLLSAEIFGRAAVSLTKGFGLFMRIGVWTPASRLDVTVRGAESGYVTAAIAPVLGFGVELMR